MEALVRFFVERHLLVNIIAFGLVMVGMISISSVPREFIPAVAMPTVNVTAMLPGESARDMETKVTIPIEEALEELDGIDDYHSIIADNTSFTTIEIFDDYDKLQVAETLVEIRDAIDGITDFPDEMDEEPQIDQFNPAKFPVMEVALAGEMDAIVPVAKDLERRIERLSGVSQVNPVGLQDPEVRVLVDPVKAQEHGIALIDVIRAVDRRNISATGGLMESSDDRRQVVVWSRFSDPARVGETVLRSVPGMGVLRIRDIARIEAGREDTTLRARTDGQPGISLVVRKRANADLISVVDGVNELMRGYQMPEGVTYKVVDDRSFITRNRLELMLNNGIMGIILVAAVLFFFLKARAAIWVLIGIPIVFMGTLALFREVGVTVNLFTLTGLIIVLGMVVDDAVVVTERIAFRRGQGLSGPDAAVKGTVEMSKPVAAAALTTVLAFLPLTALGGVPGRLFWQVPVVVVIALIFSLIESFIILPAHMSGGRSDEGAEAKRPFVVKLEVWYRGALRRLLKIRLLVVSVAFSGLVLIMVLVAPQVPFILFPQNDASTLFVKISTPLGTPLEQTESVAAELEAQVARITAVDLEAITARIGHQNTNSLEKQRGDAENEALLIAKLKNTDREMINSQWIQVLKEEVVLPDGAEVVYQSEFLGPPTDQPVTIHVLANDDATRRGIAMEMAQWLNNTPGVTQVEIDERPGTPQIDLNLNYEKLAMLGLDPQDVGFAVNAAFFGIEASEHRDLDDTTEIRVQFDPASRVDLDALLETPVRSATGQLVRLRDVVNPVEIPAVNRIYHRDGSRAITVRASFEPGSGHSALAFAVKTEMELFPKFSHLPDVFIYNGGEAESTEETAGSLGTAAILVLLGIGVTIWILLGSFLESLFVLAVIPFAVAGVIFTFWVHGLPLGMTAMMGAVGLSGVVVNASIVMVDSIHRRLKQVHELSVEESEAFLDAVVERLRPIIVTTLTTLGGVLPTAYGFGGYDFIVSPMSLAIGWGLAFSTMITLFVVPVLYSLASDINGIVHRLYVRARSRFAGQATAAS